MKCIILKCSPKGEGVNPIPLNYINKQIDYLQEKFQKHSAYIDHPAAVMEAHRLGGKDYSTQLAKIKDRQGKQNKEQFIKATTPWTIQMYKDAHDRQRENQADEIGLLDNRLALINNKNKSSLNYLNTHTNLRGQMAQEDFRKKKLQEALFLERDRSELEQARREAYLDHQRELTLKDATSSTAAKLRLDTIDNSLKEHMAKQKELESYYLGNQALQANYLSNHQQALARHNAHDRNTAMIQGAAALGEQIGPMILGG